jgi:rubrerythrin
MDDLKELLNGGIKLEDEFIETYLEVLETEEYMLSFPEQNQTRVKEQLEKLISESRIHKATLESIIAKI